MTDKNEYQAEKTGEFISTKSVKIEQFHENLSQETVHITVDRLRLRLTEYAGALRAKHSWIAPTGIFLPVLITLLTANFQQAWLSPSAWKTIFVLAAIGTFVWSIREVIRSRSAPSIEDLIQAIKGTNDETSSN